ncbi:hypothetical protein KUV65_06645 [Maritalea mobilis]|uniref:hypothetical protein n=1 Tax=Maritalea mobilis TaxID=483324 RepID=UPI001C93829E|nr:hypothetical protein [Maritalea mobilis]MBY6201033.1 hypothetical protein [Maritalea mobilis]
MICQTTSTLIDHVSWLNGRVRNLTILPDLNAVPQKTAVDRTAPILLVDIDIFPTFVVAVDALHTMRRNFPELPVMIASRFLAANDFTTERMHFADASLRLPVGRVALALGLNATLSNHGFFMGNRASD